MDLRTEASLSTVSTLKMGPANFQESRMNALNLDQDKIEYRTTTGSEVSNTRPVTEHSNVPSPSRRTLNQTHTHRVRDAAYVGPIYLNFSDGDTHCKRPLASLLGVTRSLPWLCQTNSDDIKVKLLSKDG